MKKSRTMSGMAAMRSQVSVFGRFQSIARSRAGVEVIIKRPCQCRSDTGHLGEVRHAGAHHPLQAAEMGEQRPAFGRPEPRNRLQHRLIVAARALAPMAGDRKTMRLVANALDQPRRGRVRLRYPRGGGTVDEEPLLSRAAVR